MESPYFGLWWVSLAEYLLVLRVLFPLLQMVQFIMAIARNASVTPWTRSMPWAGISYESLSYAFVEVWSWVTLYLNNVADVGFKLLICFCYYLTWTWFVITLIRTMMDELYLWTLCNMWHVYWIMYDLGCMLVESRSFVVLDELPGLYGLKYNSTIAMVVAIVLVPL